MLKKCPWHHLAGTASILFPFKYFMSAIKQLFALVIALFIFYMLLTRLPVFPEEVAGLSFRKVVKISIGLIFTLGGILIYFTAKKQDRS